MKQTLEEYTIATYFLPALINGDITYLEDEEHEQLDKWVDKVRAGRVGHWSVPDYEELDFARDDVTGLYGIVTKIDFVVMEG